MRDSISPLPIIFVLAFALLCGAFYLAWRHDEETLDMGKECKDKGGVFYKETRQCIDVKTIPLKDR